MFSIDYPLASATVHPSYEQPADTELAVQWVRTNAASLGIDPASIALFGTSAGVDIAFDAAYQAQRSDPAARVQAVAGWSGVYDFVDEFYRDPSNPDHVGNGTEYIGCTDLTDAGCFAVAQAASPITYASHDDPPTLVATSTDFTDGCESVEPQNAIEMVNALRARGAPVVFQTNHACAHAAGYVKAKIDPPGTGTMVDNLIAFFDQQFSASPTPPTTPAPLPARWTGPAVVTPSSTCTPTARRRHLPGQRGLRPRPGQPALRRRVPAQRDDRDPARRWRWCTAATSPPATSATPTRRPPPCCWPSTGTWPSPSTTRWPPPPSPRSPTRCTT